MTSVTSKSVKAPSSAARSMIQSAQLPSANVGAQTLVPDFSFAAQGWSLQAHSGQRISPVFAGNEEQATKEIISMLTAAVRRTGRMHIVCGLIPFSTSEPASLLLTDNVTMTPRSLPECASEGNGLPINTPTPTTRSVVPDSPHYRKTVAQALNHIATGRVKKIVLSRRMRVSLPDQMAPERAVKTLLQHLNVTNPTADVFHMRLENQQYWLGASPEVVADVHNGTLMSHPLAGSRPRLPGQDAPDPNFHSANKDQREHAYVVDHIRESLANMAEYISSPVPPQLFATDCMWHLGTRITAKLCADISALTAALRLHPTPAVCGSPVAEATKVISELEQSSRGFYSGLVGWTDAHGNGRWSLVLRSAELNPTHITLHAGAGVVDGSDPAAEHAETAAKFGTMLAAIGGLK